jgi:hypothetical protein
MPIAITVTPKNLQLGDSFNTHVSITNPSTTTGYDFILTLNGRFVGATAWTLLATSAQVHVNANSTVTYDFPPNVTSAVGTAEIMVRGTLVIAPTTYEDSNIEQIIISAVSPPPSPINWIPIVAGLGAVAAILVAVIALRRRK